ncbi:MFS general substrate transporter [Setomelanomma holmii]|uniref:MFS general substrate transporter n=1 Tax=Setomelanomma holmii TaxID=210430 RepID=A0A9P4LRT9_9PLEO|nr:MFS general substrate transporter [Setomelanomma holmii]
MTTLSSIQTIELQQPSILTIKPSTHHNDTHAPSPRLSENRQDVDDANVNTASSYVLSLDRAPVSNLKLTLTILQPCVINFFGSFTSGTITVGLPTIASSLSLQRSLYTWPASVYALTSGAMLFSRVGISPLTLLIAGSVGDIIGAHPVELMRIFLLRLFALICGFAQSGVQLVVFRALQGIALAMHIPASVALITASIPAGRARNIGFGCIGMSQPLGYPFGLVLSGLMIEKAGWRSSFYLAGAGILLGAVTSWATLPKQKNESELTGLALLKKLRNEVDWVGGSVASAGLTMLSYVLATISADLSTIRSSTTIALLCVSLCLLIAFPFWMYYREKKGKSALIPNSLWRNLQFASTCAMVALTYGVMNSMPLFSSLYFQEIQNHSTLTTSLYLLPNMVVSVLLNLSVDVFVHRLPARWLIAISSLLCSFAPLMMALVNPQWRYWYLEVWAQVLAPMGRGVLYTVGLIIMSDSFPEKTQALAGAVFSTVGQFGASLGVGICQVVALGVMGPNGDSDMNDDSRDAGPGSEDIGDMLKGYRSTFWTMFGSTLLCVLIAMVGLRKSGNIGVGRRT